MIHSLRKLDSSNLLRTGWSVVEDIAILQRKGCVRLSAFNHRAARIAWRDQATVEGSINTAVVVQFDNTTHTRDLAFPDHCEQVSAASYELVIAREGIEEQVIAANIIFDTSIPHRHCEAAGRGGSA